jgi:hypothetical protein
MPAVFQMGLSGWALPHEFDAWVDAANYNYSLELIRSQI